MISKANPSQALRARDLSESEKLWHVLEKDEHGFRLVLGVKPTGHDFQMKMTRKMMEEEIAAEKEELRRKLIGDTPRGNIVVEPRHYRDLTDITTVPPIGIMAGARFLEMPKPTEPKPRAKTVPVVTTTETDNKFHVEPRHYRSLCDIDSPVTESMKAAGMLLLMPKRGNETAPTKPNDKKGKASASVQSVPSTIASSSTPTPSSSRSPAIVADTALTTPNHSESSSFDLNPLDNASLKTVSTKATTVSALSDPKGKGKARLA